MKIMTRLIKVTTQITMMKMMTLIIKITMIIILIRTTAAQMMIDPCN